MINPAREKAEAHWEWEKELLRLLLEFCIEHPSVLWEDLEPLLEYVAVTHFEHGWKHCEDAQRSAPQGVKHD